MGDLNIIEILIYLINFCITLTLLYLLLYKPVSKFLGERNDRIANSLKKAETVSQEAEIILQQAKEELASTRENARKLSHETMESAIQDAESILDNAKEKSSKIVSQAREQMEEEKQAALEQSFAEIVSFASGLATRILTREVTIDDNREIVENFFSEKSAHNQAAPETQLEKPVENETIEKEEKKS